MNYKVTKEMLNILKTALPAANISGIPAFSNLASKFNNFVAFPGFVDVHVHLRVPGFSYKETIATGTKAAARGGYTVVCSMPNLKPVPDNLENLNKQIDIIKQDAIIDVYPYASITVNQEGLELSNFDELAAHAFAFSDDGRGIQTSELMKKAMYKAKELDKIIVAHCEDNSLLNGGYIHDGEYAKVHGHKGISSESEWRPIARDIELAKETGCAYHVCHISTKESVNLIRNAKQQGVNITCETAPHYLLLNDSMLEEKGNFKMNPPIRSEEDRLALIDGIKDGTIDMIATDHAPHSEDEKNKGLEKSLMGVVGLETAFQLLYTNLVKNNIISLDKLVELMCINPRNRFNIPFSDNDFCVWDLEAEYTINPNDFLSMGRSTPFEDYKVNGKCIATVKNGKLIYITK